MCDLTAGSVPSVKIESATLLSKPPARVGFQLAEPYEVDRETRVVLFIQYLKALSRAWQSVVHGWVHDGGYHIIPTYHIEEVGCEEVADVGHTRHELEGRGRGDEARRGEARRGEVRRGEARRGEARRGEARRGERRQGEASRCSSCCSSSRRHRRRRCSQRPHSRPRRDQDGEQLPRKRVGRAGVAFRARAP